jgi:hypothetical protein
MTTQRLKPGKGIRVRWGDEVGEVVRYYTDSVTNQRSYEIRLGPAHFVHLPRSEFVLEDKVIPFATLAKLREMEL